MTWEFIEDSFDNVQVVVTPPLQSLSALFFELHIDRLPFLLNAAAESGNHHTETISMYYSQALDIETEIRELPCPKGFIQFSGHYTQPGIVSEKDFEDLLIDYTEFFLKAESRHEGIQEKWAYGRKKEWFHNLDYYAIVMSYPDDWVKAVEENLRLLKQKK